MTFIMNKSETMKSKLRTYLYKPIDLVFVFASNSVECDCSKRKADLASSEVSTALIDLAFAVHLVFRGLLVVQLHFLKWLELLAD